MVLQEIAAGIMSGQCAGGVSTDVHVRVSGAGGVTTAHHTTEPAGRPAGTANALPLCPTLHLAVMFSAKTKQSCAACVLLQYLLANNASTCPLQVVGSTLSFGYYAIPWTYYNNTGEPPNCSSCVMTNQLASHTLKVLLLLLPPPLLLLLLLLPPITTLSWPVQFGCCQPQLVLQPGSTSLLLHRKLT